MQTWVPYTAGDKVCSGLGDYGLCCSKSEQKATWVHHSYGKPKWCCDECKRRADLEISQAAVGLFAACAELLTAQFRAKCGRRKG